MGGTKISTNAANSRMFDFYDKLMGLGLSSGLYAGKQREINEMLHTKVTPYIRTHHPEYVPAGCR